MYIVTGGAGFIGSNLVRGLNRRGIDDILVVDDLERGDKHLNLNGLRFADYVDFRDFERDLERFAAPKAVLHQGACSDTTERNGRYMLSVNFEYTKKLFAWSERHGAPFLYASSAATYGDGANGFREEPACEWPLNVYGFSKLLFDRWMRPRLAAAKCQVVGLRYFNVYGPQEHHKDRMASVIFKLHGQATRGEPLKIFEGSDKFVRDFVHVDDCVAVNLHFLDNPARRGIFNCGSGAAESFEKLARTTASHYAGAKIEYLPFPADLVGKYQAFTQADLTQLRRNGGYEKPFATLEQGIASYVRILKSSGGYYRD